MTCNNKAYQSERPVSIRVFLSPGFPAAKVALERKESVMGEIADDMVDGACCSRCGEYFEAETGYPALCDACYENASEEDKKHNQKSHEKTI